jgi:uncharacterized radical SAM superfamily Fe-S cluster-containing enzyme
MNRDDIIRMAREAGWQEVPAVRLAFAGFDIERFADLVAEPLQSRITDLYRQLDEAEKRLDEQYKLGMEAEREACAQLCESRFMGDLNREDMEARRCAAAIRARGET